MNAHEPTLRRSRSAPWAVVGLSIATAMVAVGVHSEEHTDHHSDRSLGKVDFQVSCTARAQVEFEHGVLLLHHMTYPQARAAFERILATDDGCAMAHWGVAMTLFQPLWPTRPSPSDLERGWSEVQIAKKLAPATERERLLIASAEAFFTDPISADYWARIRRWEEASYHAYRMLPDDSEAALFYALAHLATTPSGGTIREHADTAAAILLRVYERNPDHPGAMHYLVHANDVPGREHELLEVTRRYEQIAPNNPHALHMPTHIYTRLGDWDAVIQGNLRAADAALSHPAGEHQELVWDEFAHAVEYLVYAYLQEGADVQAAAQVQRLQETDNLEPTFKTAFHLASTQARYVLERGAWSEAARIVPRSPEYLDWDRSMWAEATAHFARGLGAAHLREQEKLESALARLRELHDVAHEAREDLFARNIEVLRLELSAWAAHTRGEREESIRLMHEAAVLETATPKHAVTPAPTLPAYELLGDLYSEQANPGAALDAYRKSLESYPRRFNSLLGAARSARDLNDAQTARDYYAQLLEVAGAGTRKLGIEEAKRFIARR